MADPTGINRLQTAIYESDLLQEGETDLYYTFGLRLLPEVLTFSLGGVTNSPLTTPTGIIAITASTDVGRKKHGVHARFITIERRVGTAPTILIIKRRVPILTRLYFESCKTAQLDPSPIEYQNESDWTIVSVTAEKDV